MINSYSNTNFAYWNHAVMLLSQLGYVVQYMQAPQTKNIILCQSVISSKQLGCADFIRYPAVKKLMSYFLYAFRCIMNSTTAYFGSTFYYLHTVSHLTSYKVLLSWIDRHKQLMGTFLLGALYLLLNNLHAFSSLSSEKWQT